MRSSNGFLLASLLACCATAQAQDGAADSRPASQPTRPKDMAELFAWLGAMEGLEAGFREEKHIALLAVPLVSRGTLYYMRPGYLARVVAEPEPASVVISPRALVMRDGKGEETIDLHKSDDVRMFVTSLVQVFAGDRDELEGAYEIAFEPVADSEAGWILTLEPRAEPLTQMLRRLSLRGEGRAVVEVEVVEPNGDRSVTTIEHADPERAFSEEEREELFGIRPQ